MSNGENTLEENLEALRELAAEHPDHDTVMDLVEHQGNIPSISDVSWAKQPKSYFHESYEEIKSNPELVNEHPEIIDVVTDMIVNKPGLNNQYLELLLLAILIEDNEIISRIESQIPKLINRFKTFPHNFETIMTQYWSLDYDQSNIVTEEEDLTYDATDARDVKDLNKKQAAELLDSMKFQAESLGYLLGACSYEYPDQVVPLTSTALEFAQISSRDDNELPEHPSVNNMTIKSKSCISNMVSFFLTEAGSIHKIDDPNPGEIGQMGTFGQALFSDQTPPGFIDQLTTHHKKYVNMPYNKVELAAALSESDVHLIEPVIPDIIEMLKTPYAITALINLAKQSPDSLLSYQDELRQLLTEGEELEGRTKNLEIEYDREILAILESVSVSQLDEFWDFTQIWIDTAEQTSPEVKRAIIELIKKHIRNGGSLDSGSELIHSLANDPDWQARQHVAEVLSEDGSGSYHSLLVELSDDPVPEVQDTAREALNQN
jgi:hypothetical protein